QLGQPPGDLGFPHPGRAHHDDIFRGDLLPKFLGEPAPAITVAQGDGHRPLGLVLAYDVFIQRFNGFPWGHDAHTSSKVIWPFVNTQISEAISMALRAISRAGRSVFSFRALAAARA